MKTKEAINWLFDIWHEWENIYGSTAEINLIEGKKYDGVIELLKRGEKFEQMWREFENKDLTYKSDSPIINDEMYYIEQKYFPKA